jgi:hypothetical protein
MGYLAFIFSQPSDRQHVTRKTQVIVNAKVTRIAKSDLAENLAEICGQFPDLEVVIKKWPQLSDDIIKTIIKIIS